MSTQVPFTRKRAYMLRKEVPVENGMMCQKDVVMMQILRLS
jgi:hypothetical protein